jgi:putative membrane protein
MTQQVALVLHVFGVVLWVGSTVAAAWMAASLVSDGETKALSAIRKTLLMIGAPGMLLAWIAGLAILVPGWDRYSHAGWMHGKLTIALVLSALHGVLVGRVRRAVAGTATPNASLFVGVAVAYLVLALAAIGLVLLQPGG